MTVVVFKNPTGSLMFIDVTLQVGHEMISIHLDHAQLRYGAATHDTQERTM